MQKSVKKIAVKKAHRCVEKVHILNRTVNDKNIMHHLVALAVPKVSEKKVPTKIEKYFTPVEQ
jgi:hypothetical protein